MKRFYFIDNNIYFQNKKMPPRKVELFSVKINMNDDFYTGYDKDGNFYKLNINHNRLIVEED